jgi:hypothetical protein
MLFFSIPETVPIEIMPGGRGAYSGRRLWRGNFPASTGHRIAAATRRAVLMRFAHAAARRLHRLSDPEALVGRLARVARNYFAGSLRHVA